MTSPSIADQFGAAAALEFALHFLERWSKTPWITENTTKITAAFRVMLAFFATLGLTWHYDGGTLVITGLSVSVISLGLWNFFRQYALQHGFGHLIRNGNLDKFREIVGNVVRQEIAAYADQQAKQSVVLIPPQK